MSRVLIVDDSETVRDDLARILGDAGHDIVTAENGLVGVEVATGDSAIDLILTDLNMPVMTGMDMVREIKAKKGDRTPPILVLTTETTRELREEAKDYGVIGWIVKPYGKDALVKVVSKIISS